MPVIARRLNERTLIRMPDGTECWVTIVAVDRGKVRLGIQAPSAVKIFREEIAGTTPPDTKEDAA